MPRPRDIIEIETDQGIFDRFESLEVVNDLNGAAEATFTIGDDGCWQELDRIVAPGQPFIVRVNKRLRMTGRAEVNEVPAAPGSGVKIQLVIRTKMADARYRSADPNVKIEKASIKDFLLALYAPLGYTEADFQFSEAAARDLMTGKSSNGKPPVDLEPIKLEQAKVNPPETIFQCAERHLKRHHMMHWDAGDGRIVVGAPDDEQLPLTRLQCRRGAASVANNVLSFKRTRDWSELPSEVWVYGGTPGKTLAKSAFREVAVDLDVAAVAASTGHFNRMVLIPAEQAKTRAHAVAQAQRELSSRSRRKDAWEITTDGWSYWNGHESITWAINTTTDVHIDAVGGPTGRYLIHRVSCKLGVHEAPTTTLHLVGPGIFLI